MGITHRIRWRWVASGLSLLVGLCWLYFWWHRPPAVEFDNLKYIQLLRTAVSAEREDYVTGVERAVRQRHDDRAMTPQELAHFLSIISVARGGQWERAHRMAMEFERAQAYRSRGRPRRES